MRYGIVLMALLFPLLGCGGGGGAAATEDVTVESVAGVPPAIRPEIWPEVKSPLAADPELETKVEEILAGLSLEEKVGQVLQAEIRHVTPEDVRKYRLGSILNGGGSHPDNDKHADPEDWLALADAFYEASMDTSNGSHAIPIFWGVDAVHGHNNVVGATLFPHNVGLGATRDADLLREIGRVTALEVAVTGIDWNFAPTVAVARDDRWGRAYESYSEDPALVAELGAAMIEGLQGKPGSEDFLAPGRVLATAKHFLGDGGTHLGKDQGDNRSSEEELRDVHGAGYVTALEVGAQTVMASFNSWHGHKMHGHHGLLTDVLKDRMGFDGVVVGDWNGHGQVAGCDNDDCAAAFNAGVDLFMVPEDWRDLYDATLEQARSGEITAERLDDAVRRILRVKMRAGLFDAKPSSRPQAGRFELLGAAEHRAIARRAVRQSLVLLKNDGGLLPLDPKQRILIAGDGADSVSKQAGGWTLTWQGTDNEESDFPGASSIGAGIRAAVEAAGGTVEISEKGKFRTRPDVAVVVFGEDPYAEFRGDLTTLEYGALHGKGDLKLLRRLQEAGIPVVSIFLSGRPLWVNPEINASDAFVAAWLPGSEGAGVADVILRTATGEINHDFSGRLAFSWPKTPGQALLHQGSEGEPLFPFGYGLSYSDETALGVLQEEVDGTAASRFGVFFDGGAVAPWQVRIADAEADEVHGVLVGASAAATPSGELEARPVDHEVQEDARGLRFTGASRSWVEIMTSAEPVDLERETNGAMALGFTVRLDSDLGEGTEVELMMGCGDDCSGKVDLGPVLADLPVGEWRELAVSLRCFADAGVDVTQIDVPFRLTAEGELALSLADVALVEGDEAICP